MRPRRSQKPTSEWSEQLKAWARQHLDAAKKALGYYKQTPITSLLTLISITVALAVPATLYLGASSFSALFDFQEPRQITAYMKLDIEGNRLTEIADQFQRRPDIEKVDIITREQSLKQFRESTDMEAALDLLKENPLPAVLVIHPAEYLQEIESIRALSQEIEQSGSVEQVSIDADWLSKLFALGASLRKLVWLAGLALAATVILLIHYSLRSEIIKRREEIQVVKLVGGSPAFVQRPFIYFAVILGFVGAVLALLTVKLVSMSMMPMIKELSALYGKPFNLAITAEFSLTVIALAIILSIAAALLTIRSLLKHIELDRS